MTRKLILILILICPLFSMSQMQQMAIWTGNSKPATSIAGNVGFNCEYDLYGKKFWVFSPTICPVSIYVQ